MIAEIAANPTCEWPTRPACDDSSHVRAPAGCRECRPIAVAGSVQVRIGQSAAGLAIVLAAGAAQAVGIATEQQIEELVVTGDRQHVAQDVPNTVASRTADDLRIQNVFNPEDALRYMPNLMVRKRYIGDRNALISGRSYSNLQAPRGLVLMDNYLISNFLGRFDAPRWNMIAPEEIARVDVLYGPYSALHSGNSIGSTVVVSTRKPTKDAVSVRAIASRQHFEAYGVDDDFDANQLSVYGGRAFGDVGALGDVWATLTFNRQDATSHPMQYQTVSANAAGNFPGVTGAATPVTGIEFDTDPNGRRRAVFGASGGAFDETVQVQAKLRAGADLTDWLQADGFVAYWRNDTNNSNESFLRDAAGNPVESGRVSQGGFVFNVPDVAFAPSSRDEQHLHWGITLRTTFDAAWNGSLVVSHYDILDDEARQSNLPEGRAANAPGTLTRRDGTAWTTYEAQVVYDPQPGDFGDGRHALAFGVHHNQYQLRNPVFNAADWRHGSTGLNQDVYGETELTALYVEDRITLSDAWTATVGYRYERWRAFDGGQFFSGLPALSYPSRDETGHSPKLSVSWAPNESSRVRASVGRGVRFPTVVELFQGTRTSTSIQVNDPDLKPEVSTSFELAYEHFFGQAEVRVSLFQDDIEDTIWSQTNQVVVPNVTQVQNVDEVRVRGIELAFSMQDLLLEGLRLEGNVAFNDSEIEKSNFLASEGKHWVRIPKSRANLQASYRPTDAWMFSAALRRSGRQYNTLDNIDSNPDVFGGVSRFTMVDVRASFFANEQLEFALGVDNLTDEEWFQAHPMPQRTVFAEVRWNAE